MRVRILENLSGIVLLKCPHSCAAVLNPAPAVPYSSEPVVAACQAHSQAITLYGQYYRMETHQNDQLPEATEAICDSLGGALLPMFKTEQEHRILSILYGEGRSFESNYPALWTKIAVSIDLIF